MCKGSGCKNAHDLCAALKQESIAAGKPACALVNLNAGKTWATLKARPAAFQEAIDKPAAFCSRKFAESGFVWGLTWGKFTDGDRIMWGAADCDCYVQAMAVVEPIKLGLETSVGMNGFIALTDFDERNDRTCSHKWECMLKCPKEDVPITPALAQTLDINSNAFF